jgi:polyisoprenoid-binding protein YceI
MKVSFYRYMLAAFAAASLTAAGSALAQVDVAKSAVTATSKQMNVPVEGKFNKFTAQIRFDPAKPAEGSAQLTIDVGSYDLGGNQFKVTGKLTIKGKSQTVTVPVTVTQQGGTQSFDGSLPIKRLQFDIGTGEWKDTSVVADDVVIKFHIVSSK